MAQAQCTCLNCWPSTPLLDSFVLLQILDYIEFLPSKQRQTNKDLFHFKPLLSGTISFKLLDIPHLSPHWSLLCKHTCSVSKRKTFRIFVESSVRLPLLKPSPPPPLPVWTLKKIINVEWLCHLTVLEIACRCVRWIDWYSWMFILIVCVTVSFFVLSLSECNVLLYSA